MGKRFLIDDPIPLLRESVAGGTINFDEVELAQVGASGFAPRNMDPSTFRIDFGGENTDAAVTEAVIRTSGGAYRVTRL